MTIKEMLMKRDTVELLRMLRSKDLPFPIDVAKEDETRILAAYYDENDRTIPFLLEYLEEDEPDWDEYEMTEDKLKILKDNHYRQLELAGFVKNIEDKREDMCMALSDKLIDEELMADAYLNMPDESVDIMRRVISDGKRKGDHQELDVDIKGDDKYPVELLRNLGYCDTVLLDAYDSEDEYEHIISIIVPNEICSVFGKADTKEADFARRECRFVMDCCYVATKYYEETTVPMVYRIYLKWCEESGNEHPLSIEEFEDIAVSVQKRPDSCYELYEYNGRRYFLSYSFSDDDEDEHEYLKEKFDYLDSCDEEFYIPPLAEGNEYRKTGYWPSRSGYARLMQFVTDFYLDEQYIHNSSLAMFRLACDDEDYLRRGFMSKDDVEREANEVFYDIVMALACDYEVEDILKDNEHLTIPVTDEAKKQFREALEECHLQTNLPHLNGFTRENHPRVFDGGNR